MNCGQWHFNECRPWTMIEKTLQYFCCFQFRKIDVQTLDPILWSRERKRPNALWWSFICESSSKPMIFYGFSDRKECNSLQNYLQTNLVPFKNLFWLQRLYNHRGRTWRHCQYLGHGFCDERKCGEGGRLNVVKNWVKSLPKYTEVVTFTDIRNGFKPLRLAILFVF